MRRPTRFAFLAALGSSLFGALLGSSLLGCAGHPKPVEAAGPGGAGTTEPVATPATPDRPAATTPPVARKLAHVTPLHGIELHDDYFWLREKDTPEVLDYLRAENAYTDAVMKPTEALQGQLYDEMLARIQQTDLSVPYRRGQYWYYDRFEDGKQYPIHCRKQGTLEAPEQVMIDVNELAKQSSFVNLAPLREGISDDATLLAWRIDTTGFRQYTLHVRDLAKGTDLSEAIPRVTSVAWATDGKTLFYSTEDAVTKRSSQIWRHTVGDAADHDKLVYEEKDEHFDTYLERTRSRKYVMIASTSATASEYRYLRADKPNDEPRLLQARAKDIEYYVDHQGDRFYIWINDKGRNFRVVTAPVKDPKPAKWKELIPHRDDVMIEGVDALEKWLVIKERKGGLDRIVYRDLKGAEQELEFGEPVYSASPEINVDYTAQTYRYRFTSLVTPESIYEVALDSGKKTLLKQTPVLGGYDASAYQQERIEATAADGTKVPIALVYRKGLARDGSAPLLLDGYGSYGFARPDVFDANRVSLLDRGVIFATAHIRGGGEMGKRWHDQGRMKQKRNTFTDFIACAEHLVAEKYTASDRLAIIGGSAGGLLIGAVVNMRPDLFKAAVAQVPFVDVLNTMLDASLPLTVGEFEEWGNPTIKDEFEYMATYSPYDNVGDHAYPAMLVVSSYNDSQVMYWEPTKWVAKLRAHKTDTNPLLLRVNLDPAGHGGKSGRFEKLRERAFQYAFILGQVLPPAR